MLDWLTIVEINGVTTTRIEHWCGKLPRWTKVLRTLGKVGVLKIATKTTAKGKPRGISCLFVGYALGHTANVYRMWITKTNRVYETRDVN